MIYPAGVDPSPRIDCLAEFYQRAVPELFGFIDFRELLLDVPADDVIGGPLQV